MLARGSYTFGLQIDHVTTCDFDKLDLLSNADVMKRARGGDANSERLMRFVTERMGIEHRYFVPPGMDSLDLARQAITKLLAKSPNLTKDAEAFILAGISNPLPTVCQAALLAGEFGFTNVGCLDLKSGCSTGILALMQSLDWFQHGSRKTVIVCTETFSRFTDPQTLQMSASTGDGACALEVSSTQEWKVLGAVHGSDPIYLKTMYVPGKYPIDKATYNPTDYVFHFENKSDTLEKLAYYWQKSLQDLLKTSGVKGSEITHYVAHQVDQTKNREVALSVGIPAEAIHQNFREYGNMGCPTVFINYAHQLYDKGTKFKKGDIVVFHAVGGGLTWAGLCLQKVT